MNIKKHHKTKLDNNITRIILVVVIILMIPLVAMQFTTNVNWNTADFIIAGLLLFGVGFAYGLITRKIRNKYHRIVLFAIILLFFVYLWAELAVGIFTNWGS